MRRFRPSGWLDWTFEIFLVLKGLDGLLEIGAGLVLLIVPQETLTTWLHQITGPELAEDPQDFIATHLLSAGTAFLAGSLFFAALYVLAHGLVKVVLVGAVLLDRLWAYPWMIAVLIAFIAYQAWLLVEQPSTGLVALTVFDVVMVWLTRREYGKRRDRRSTADALDATTDGGDV